MWATTDVFFMCLLRSCLLNWAQSISVCFLWHFHPTAVKPKKELISIIQWSDLISEISHHLSYGNLAGKKTLVNFIFSHDSRRWRFVYVCKIAHSHVFYCVLCVFENDVNHCVKRNSLLPNGILSTLISFLTYLEAALEATDFCP